MRWTTRLMLLAMPAALAAQEREPAVIQVAGRGSVETEPDMAMLTYSVMGEGATADAASRALATKATAIRGGLLSVLGQGAVITTSEVNLTEVRGADCRTGYGSPAMLSQGACAVIGYNASLRGSVETGSVEKVGTAVGLASRLGAQQAQTSSFGLRDPAAAQARATQVAVRDAKGRAATLAAAAGVRLGMILTLNDGPGAGIEDDVPLPIVATAVAAPPAPPPPPPVQIDVKPAPIETSARVSVRYAILP